MAGLKRTFRVLGLEFLVLSSVSWYQGELKKESEVKIILGEAEKKENHSNQILEFTKEIKNSEKNFRFKILEVLWKIIYSDGVSDMYESTLMRRLSGLLYVSDRESGIIKQSISNNKTV